MARESLRHLSEIQRLLTLGFQEAERVTARTQALWEDAQNDLNDWSYAAEEMYQTGVGPGDTTRLVDAHRWIYSTNFLRRDRSSFISIGCSPSDGCGKLHAKRRTTTIQRSRRSTFGLNRLDDPAHNNPNNIYTTKRLPATGVVPSVLSAVAEESTLCNSNQQNSVPGKKETEIFRTSQIQRHS